MLTKEIELLSHGSNLGDRNELTHRLLYLILDQNFDQNNCFDHNNKPYITGVFETTHIQTSPKKCLLLQIINHIPEIKLTRTKKKKNLLLPSLYLH